MGGVIGGVFLIAFVVGIVLFFVIRSRRNNQNNLARPSQMPPQIGLGNPQVNLYPYPPTQQYYPPPNNPQGAFAPQANPNQYAFPPNPELNPNHANQQGFNQAAVSHIPPNQNTPSPQQPTTLELHSNQLNLSHGVSTSKLSQNQSAIPQQQPAGPELYGNQPSFGQGTTPSELYQSPPAAVPQQQPTHPELDSRPANQAYLQQGFVSDGQPPQMRGSSGIHEAP